MQHSAIEHRRLQDGDVLGPQKRVLSFRADFAPNVDTDARTVELTFSSEYPVDRWFGKEVLSHAPGAADLARLNDGGSLLWGHNPDDVLGVIERAWIGDDKRGHALVRFGKDERGTWAMNQVQDRIIRNVSFMYRASDYVCETDDPDRFSPDDVYTAQRWEAFEISLLSIPADPTVGVGRSADQATQTRVHVVTRARTQPSAAAEPSTEGKTMNQATDTTLEQRGGAAAAAAPATPPAAPNWDDLRRQERERQNGIRALGERWKNQTLADLLIEGGATIEQARAQFLEALDKSAARTTPVGGASVDLTDKERRSFSYMRAVRALISQDWKAAGFEREVSNELAKQLGRDVGGSSFFLPNDLPFAPDEQHLRAWEMLSTQGKVQKRAPYLVGSAAQGGNLVQTQLLYDSFVEVLRNQMVTAILGARYLTGLVGNVDIPRQISQTGVYWVAESGAPTEAEATFDKVSLRPKTVGALSKMSRLMLLQATPAIEMLARADLMAVIALGLDLAALSGSGASNQPTGIVNQAGVISVVGGTNGANLTFDHLISLKYATKFANAPQAAAAYAMNSKAIGYLSTLKASTGQYLWDPQGGLVAGSPDRVKGSPYAESQQLRSTLTKGTSNGICSELIYGNWQELFIAMWGVTEIALNPYDSTGFTTGDVLLRAFQTCDIGVRHGASFSVMSDALTPGF
jgi:HK97 family phage major capsid protein